MTITKLLINNTLRKLKTISLDTEDIMSQCKSSPPLYGFEGYTSERRRGKTYEQAKAARDAIKKAIDAIEDLYLA